jgi:hypothetical protein
MQVMANDTRIRYYDTDYAWFGTVTESRTHGAGEDTEVEYLIRWDEDEDNEGPTWSWPSEIIPA